MRDMIQAIRYKKNDIKSRLISGRLFLVAQIVLVACLLLLVTSWAEAAILYLEPSSGEYGLGETFIEEIRIDNEGECLNAVEANLSFPKEFLEVKDFSQGNSILTLWIEGPDFSNSEGKISFAGGIPGGYCGGIPGITEKVNLLGRIVFRAHETDTKLEHKTDAKVEFLDASQVLLNDGLGTMAKLTTKGAVFTILPERIKVPKDFWKEEVEKDNIPPESFLPEISQDPTLFDGRYFLVFSTTDKQTGIDHYEISETRDKRQEIWKIGESPYLLEDQSLRSKILVKAVDKAGNERIEVIIPKITWKDILPWVIIILVVMGVIWWIFTKLKRNRTRNRHETL